MDQRGRAFLRRPPFLAETPEEGLEGPGLLGLGAMFQQGPEGVLVVQAPEAGVGDEEQELAGQFFGLGFEAGVFEEPADDAAAEAVGGDPPAKAQESFRHPRAGARREPRDACSTKFP